jgi:hypothetical protein
MFTEKFVNKLSFFQIIEANNKCLVEMKMGTTYKDIRKTCCDQNLFKQVRKIVYKLEKKIYSSFSLNIL